MKLSLLLAAFAVCSTAWAHSLDHSNLCCTSIMVGKKASADGSVITSHTCDSWYRTWMDIVPAKDYPNDTIMSIYEGRMHTEWVGDSTKLRKRGVIPQARHTYKFLDTAYPCLNEKQLGIGETTFTGRDTLRNSKGMFMIEELSRVALQRCATAREAITLMGSLIKEYGYGDSGECLTIADKNEVWIMEIQGEGPDKIGGVWAAIRIPDDEVAVSANISRIGRINLKDKDNCMASENVFEVAKRLGLWDGKEEFLFWKAYSGGNYLKEPKNYSVREHFILSQLAPSLNLSDTVTALPLSVKPDKKVSAQAVMVLLKSYYEGTSKDITATLKVPNPKKKATDPSTDSLPDSIVSPLANPWLRPDEIALYNALGDTTMKAIRPVAVTWCAYSTVIQLRSWLPDEIGGVAWISLDNPGESPRFPVFCGGTQLPEMLKICGNHRDRDDSALWHFRKTNKLATVRWGEDRIMIEDAQRYFRDKGARELPWLEKSYISMAKEDSDKATEILNGYTADFLAAEIVKWDAMQRTLWHKYWKGF